jgi:hypothetical protein
MRDWLVRLRNRRRGAWMWPTVIGAVAFDAVAGTHWPPVGGHPTWLAAAILGATLTLLAVAFGSSIGQMAVRLVRPDLPRIVARDYAGTVGVLAVTALLLAAGLANHGQAVADAAALQDATSRGVAWIGDHAPAPFRANLRAANTYAVQPPRLYRVCVPDLRAIRTFCVVVDRSAPFGAGVRPDGYTPNSVLTQGAY